MRKINVIDLDKTLISYDSFFKLYLIYLKKPNCFLLLFTIGILRKLKIISASQFARIVYQKISRQTNYEYLCRNLANKIIHDVNKDVVEMIKNHTDTDTINLLCSASPVDYVQLVAKAFDWLYAGSNIDSDGNFYHMYAENKLKFIKENFPETNYYYNFAISDSQTDSQLLSIFANKILYKK
jgi:phosphoserine phosphatase